VPSGPREPADEAAAFHLPPGFTVQLVAAEPDIHKPINIAFDERGRLWVTNTVEYPFPAKEGAPTRDTVKILEDFGPDGRARKITTFADNLNIPIGVLPVGGNEAIIYSIPGIFDMKDTSGSGHADQRKILIEGQAHEDTHGMTGSFTEGFDGWIYAVHGFKNTSHLRGTDGSQIEPNSGNTYRFHRDGSHVEFFTHGQVNPFGLAFDPLGNLYSSDCETKPIYLLMRGGWYPSFGKPDDGLGFAPEMCDHLYGSTAIAGLCDYVADQFPAEFANMMLVGNVVTAKVNRAQLSPRGSAFHADDAPDFLASDDKWFRPVNIKLGPDGALYVADFYNKIIGHYEVDLHHPGRDKERGRIWRISYSGGGASSAAAKPFDLSKASVAELIADLSNANFTVRMLAMNTLADHTGQPAIEPLKQALAAKPSSDLKVHGMWILKRLGALDASALQSFADDSDRAVRVHAQRVLSETEKWSDAQRAMALKGLSDSDAMVRRCAAEALGLHPAYDNIRPLLDAREHAPATDTHLIYVLRMALRNQLLLPGIADKLPPAGASDEDLTNLTDVALGAQSPASAALIVRHLSVSTEKPATLVQYVRHIARFGTDPQADEAAKIVANRFAADDAQQIDLFMAMQEGLAQRNGQLGASARAWARQLATRILNSNEPDFARWTNSPAPAFPNAEDPWTIQLRASADGNASSPFISSLPSGEKGTGILRSKDFEIPAHLSFFMAGHSGPPAQPNTLKNIVRLRAADTNEILIEAPAPRNDTARKINWDLTKFAGKRGYIEATDADNGTAYAWIAFGRFDPPVVTVPASPHRPLRTAIELAGSLKLTELSGKISQILANRQGDVQNRIAAANALVALSAADHSPQLMKALADSASPDSLKDAVGTSLAHVGSPAVNEALLEAIKSAPQKLQLSLAKSLAATSAGADALLTAVDQGKASPRLLLDSTLRERLNVSRPANLDERLAKLTANLPAADQTVQRLIELRSSRFDATKASAERGSKVFATNCQVCHRVNGQGSQIGPQLDGIGVRGVPRLCEDILDPSRNVDAAFRYSTFVLDDGDVIAGIPRREEGQTLIVADSTGKEVPIPKSKIKRRVASNLSLMPSNFGEIIKADDFNDLLAFLLSK
jgi:putative heme-binding domain-containing protein